MLNILTLSQLWKSPFCFLFNFLKFIYFWLYWVFSTVHGFSQVVAIGGSSSLRCVDFSLGFSYCWAQALGSCVSSCSTQAQNLWFTGLVLLRHVEFSWIRDQIPVPCISRQVLIHCNIREIQSFCFSVFVFVFEHLSTVGTSYKWNYVVFVLLWFFSLYFVYCLQGFINV